MPLNWRWNQALKLKMEVRSSQTGGVANPPGLARPVAGCPHQKGSGLSTLPRTTYQTYLKGGGGYIHTYRYIHTDTYIPRLLATEKQAQSGSPKMRNPTVETPTNRGERVKRCPNEIRAYMYNPSFLPSFSASSTASVSRTQTVCHLGAHLV